MRRLLAAPVVLAALALAGCNTGFEPQYRVTDLRVLAIRSMVQGSTSADAYPGDTIVLDALVANPLARPGLTVTWFGCFPVANESLLPCADPSFLEDPRKLATDPRVTPLGIGESLTLPIDPSVVSSALAFVKAIATAEPVFRCRLYTELVVIALAEAQGRRSAALKRVRVTPPPSELVGTDLEGVYVLNLDPDVFRVSRAPTDRSTCGGSTALDAGPFPAGRTVLCGGAASGSRQQFNDCVPDESGTAVTLVSTPEDLTWQWYVTAGEFPEFGGIGNANGSDLEFTRPREAFTLWTILRDGRGGEDWATFVVSALP